MTRKLTVSRRYPKSDKVRENRVAEPFAYIRLSGKWLSESGFNPGDTITVESKNKTLTIKKSIKK